LKCFSPQAVGFDDTGDFSTGIRRLSYGINWISRRVTSVYVRGVAEAGPQSFARGV